MIDETNRPETSAEATASPGGATQERTGFCQECGRPLTRETIRRVGNGIFCEPCASTRRATGGAQGWQAVNPGAYSPASGAGPAAVPVLDEPNPILAGVLGFIPGVGAMYNGQYAKGALHLIVFVVLVALADNLNWVMWWLVWGWIFYQVFEAYHTARARRDRLPLPNPFGWNDIGDRLGFRNWSGPVPARPANPARTDTPNVAEQRASYATQASSSATYPPPPTSDNPYLDPNPIPPVPPSASTPPSPRTTRVPYEPTYTGFAPGQPLGPFPTVDTRRFPVGALWLIGLGIVFLLGNLLPEWRVSGRWLVPILLGLLAVWMAVRRLEELNSLPATNGLRPAVVSVMVAPSVLFTVAVLMGLQTAYVLPMRRSWPILLVVWGALLLLQRATDPLLQPGPGAGVGPVPPASPGATSTSNVGAGPLGL